MDRNEAAEEFAKMLFQVVEEANEAVFDSMNDPSGQHRQKWEEVKRWFENQNEEGKQTVRYIVKEAIVLGLFVLAVKFDGASEYYYVGERPSEFAVNMRVYESLEETDEGSPQESIEICPTVRGADVHDLFLNLVDGTS